MNSKVLIVDDHGIVLDGIDSLLQQITGVEVIAKTINANYCLAYLKKEKVDILITDYNMPEMNGLQLLKEARKIQPCLKVIFLSMHDEQRMVQDVITAGADAYILKKYAFQEILQAVEIIKKGGRYYSPEIHKILINSLKNDECEIELTEREIDILKLLVQEMTSKEIAERLFISERTIETHRKNMLRKTNSKNTIGLIKFAYANKLLE